MKAGKVVLALAFGVGGVVSGAVSTSAGTTEPPGEALPATLPANWDVEATGTCDGGPMEMWERTGGNKQMVDALVAAWNQVYPDCQITLTYIDHAQMVPQLAR